MSQYIVDCNNVANHQKGHECIRVRRCQSMSKGVFYVFYKTHEILYSSISLSNNTQYIWYNLIEFNKINGGQPIVKVLLDKHL